MRFCLYDGKTARAFGFIKFLAVISVIFFTTFFVLKKAEPHFWSRVEGYAVSMAENAVNSAVGKVLHEKNIKYSDLVHLRTGENGEIKAIEADTVSMNILKSEIAENIEKTVLSSENAHVTISLGGMWGIPLFSGFGHKFKVKIFPSSTAVLKFADSMKESGINQVKHKIYLQSEINVTLTSGLWQKNSCIKCEIPVADTVIIGVVPKYYGALDTQIIGEDYGRD